MKNTRPHLWTASLLVRYFAPLDRWGQYDPALLQRYAGLYLQRNAWVMLVLWLLQEPLTGMPLTAIELPHTLAQWIYFVVCQPFVMGFQIAAYAWLRQRLRR